MKTIKLKAYSTIENKKYGVAKIIITPNDFEDVVFLDNITVLNFDNCQFKKLIISNESEINFKDISLHFSHCIIDNIEIESITSDKISLLFHGCILKGNIKNSNLKNIKINNCITPSLFLQYQNRIEISYTEENIFFSKWKTLLRYSDVKLAKQIISYKQSIHINNSKNINVYFNHNRKEKFGVYRSQYEQIKNLKLRYFLTKEDKKNLNINLHINFSKAKDERLKIENCILNSLSLEGSANGRISIENTKINNLFIRDFSSESETLLYNISPYLTDSKVEVHKSNMDNSWFDNIGFNGYKILSFYRTRFAKATFTSCNFPKDSLSFEKFKTLKNIHYPEKKPQNYYKDQYETFLQLKKSLENSGNYFEAQKLGAISKDSLRKVSSLPFSDKLILCLNSISNNHGLSITKPLWWLLAFSVTFYILYLLSIDRLFKPTEFDWSLVGHYFSFLDLTHRKDFLITKSEYSFSTLFLDFANKIIVGFFIFQFISAFRKYVKK
ncbi:hypothetical protein [Tenacibaculum finnmarkense]|uniref:hypothetical protein n=1 Tax=Tenacibaculum finnmarkense TaxID=2781243 RepID=UPI001EFB3177|nr:hypothetical protein [Tenacibaculum finnmarkense]MCG8208333.1 hypothetical protein [Tenacibaculum finnmarkense genomovar finnmarkense]MCG8724300.1 hypothetical protein [Tenacibaculum finnmarkense]MCG8742593.1 hypothetical protein [Tenacibaculum finnmarkense]MCG8766057.1 hypothetical protein [Tenacibaculum finnmarkense]MCG8778986.1 hypothetical protein [Tenacibaculum finnmarkense]